MKREIDWIWVLAIIVFILAICGIAIAITISVKNDNAFTKQCNDEDGWVVSHDPLICIDGDNRVIRIEQ